MGCMLSYLIWGAPQVTRDSPGTGVRRMKGEEIGYLGPWGRKQGEVSALRLHTPASTLSCDCSWVGTGTGRLQHLHYNGLFWLQVTFTSSSRKTA